MMSPSDSLEALALELRAALPQPQADLAAQRQRLVQDPRARLDSSSWALPRVTWFAMAAAALLLLGSWQVLRSRQAPGDVGAMAMATAAGHRDADGSFVALAPGALGRVLAHEKQDLRYELVRGRASVSVVPRVGHRWNVAAGPYTVTVIGTAFQVDFVPPSTLWVGVEHGIVSVAGGSLGAPIRLEKGGHLQVVNDVVTVERGGEASEPDRSAAPPLLEGTEPPAAPAPPSDAASAKPGDDWESRYAANDYRKAVALAHAAGFAELIGSLPEARLVKLADAARLGGDEAGARLALAALERRFTGGAAALRATFLLGTLDARAGNRAGAIASFQKYLSSAPSGPFASEATGRLMQLYSARGQGQEARRMAESYLKREPNGPYVRLAQSLSKAP